MKALAAAAIVARLALGLPLVWAGWEKMRAFDWWREKFGEMQLVPDLSVGVVAAAFPGIELVIGLALIIGFWRRASTILCAALYGVFAAVMAWLLWSGRAVECGCFGPESDLVIDGPALGLRLVAVAASLVLLGAPGSAFSLDSVLARGRDQADLSR